MGILNSLLQVGIDFSASFAAAAASKELFCQLEFSSNFPADLPFIPRYR
jgi:hypothetical protein